MGNSNLVGQRYGMLVVIEEEMADRYPSGNVRYRYKCKCDCGNICIRDKSTLLNKKGVSNCGCFTKKTLTTGDSKRCSNAGKHRKDSFLNGSNVQMTFRNGTIKGNTSGVQGVSWSNTAHKWHAYVGYQNYRANLGFYEYLEDAKRIRELAQIAIQDGTFEDFFFRVRGFRLEDKLQKQFKNRPNKY